MYLFQFKYKNKTKTQTNKTKIPNRVPSFSIHAGTGMTLTHWHHAQSIPIYWPACVVIYILHICTHDHAYLDRLQT